MFQVLYSPGSGKALQKMPKGDAIRIVDSLEALSKAEDPKRHIKKLKGSFGVSLIHIELGTIELS